MATTATYDHTDAVHAAGGGQSVDPVGDEGAPAHRQQRLGGPGQVSEPPAAVGRHVPLQPGSVPGGKNDSFHPDSGALTRDTRRSVARCVTW